MELKVWLELPKVDNVEAAKAHCDAANAVLNKLLGKEGLEFFFATEEQRYCRTFYNGSVGGMPANGYTELSDRGQWFNLAFLAYGKVEV